jgi:teichuronic acid biosynthesis glycosyltransferase TuaG
MKKSPLVPPLVSIITPAYNSSGFITETIKGALAQTCADFELIVVDDESTDRTIDVVHEVAAGDPRVIVMVSPHGGPATARNVALDAVRGKFIALLDSDDVWMPEYLESQLTLLGRFPDRAIVTANAFNRGGRLDGQTIWRAAQGCRRLSLRDLIRREDSVCIMSVFRREVVARLGGFDRRYTGNEDYEFWLRAANAGFGVVQNLRPLGYYRRRDDSLSSNDIRMLNGITAVLESVSRLRGPIEAERAEIQAKIDGFRYELLKVELRTSLSNNDAAAAVTSLKTMSELRKSWSLAVAAKIGTVWPDLLRRAFELKQTLRVAS